METDFQPSVQQLEAILQDPTDSYTFVSTHGKNPQLIPYLIQLLTQPSYETNSPLRTQAAILIRNALDSWYRKLSPLQIENSAKVELGRTLIENVLAKGERDSVVRKQVTLCVGKIGKSNLDANLSNLFEDLNLHIRNVIGSPDWSRDPSNFYILNGCLGGFYQIIQNLISNRSTRGQLLLREVNLRLHLAKQSIHRRKEKKQVLMNDFVDDHRLPRPTSLTFITSIPPLFPCGPPYYLSKLP
jgi:hypothetical protein